MNLPNFIGIQQLDYLNNAVLRFQRNHPILQEFMNYMKQNFNGNALACRKSPLYLLRRHFTSGWTDARRCTFLIWRRLGASGVVRPFQDSNGTEDQSHFLFITALLCGFQLDFHVTHFFLRIA